MATSRVPGTAGYSVHPFAFPARTPGPLGLGDQADPGVVALAGDTPGAIGHGDHAEPIHRAAAEAAAVSPRKAGSPAVTVAQLDRIIQGTSGGGWSAEVRDHIGRLNAAMAEFEINTRLRQAMFLANIAEETGGLNTFVEAGKESYFERYDHRFGNTAAGDGYRYRGRGLVQLTFKGTYQDASDYFHLGERRRDAPRKHGKRAVPGAWHYHGLVDDPDLAAGDDMKYRIAGWFWSVYKHTNSVIGAAPRADLSDFERAVKKLNGGLNGYDVRLKYYAAALVALDVEGRDAALKAIDAKLAELAPRAKAHHPKGHPHGHGKPHPPGHAR